MSKNILVLAAHPDDETLGCGATIAKLASQGNNIHLLTFTDGISSRICAENRNTVLEGVKDSLGLCSYKFADFPDNQMDSVPLLEVCKYIENSVDYTPDLVFTHCKGCLNIDHRVVYDATLTAFRPQYGNSIQIYSYYVPSSTDYVPENKFSGNVYYNVKSHKDVKIKTLRNFYSGEMRTYPHTRSYENVENLMKVWGSEVGLEYAEKFKLVREVIK